MPRAGLRKIIRYSGEFKVTAVKLSFFARGADSRYCTGTAYSPPSRSCPCRRLVVTYALQLDITDTPIGDFHPISSCHVGRTPCDAASRLRL